MTLAKNPAAAEKLHSQGVKEFAANKPSVAIRYFREAHTLQPDNANYCNSLGRALTLTGGLKESEAFLARAVKLEPKFAMAWRNLALLYRQAGEPGKTCEAIARAIMLRPADESYMKIFMDIFSSVHFGFRERIKKVIVLTLQCDTVDPRMISRAWSWYLELDPAFTELRDLRDKDTKTIPKNLDDPYLFLGLQKMYVATMDFEKIMTPARALFLDLAAKKGTELAEHETFAASLAMQCWVNEYIYFVSPKEKKQVQTLKEGLEKKIEDTADYIVRLCLYAGYEPLLSLKNAEEILKKLQSSGPGVFQKLLAMQITERLEEAEIRKTIPSQIKITDKISKKVREQYEENPYPRWTSITTPKTPDTRRRDILIAGCGTGHQSAMSARDNPNADIYNIDLSMASLAYAARQCQALGLKNLTFEQRDILSLEGLDRKFDLIECVGVLHHMKEPETGLKILKKLLKPGGEIHIGLYSENARQDVVAVRAYIEKHKYGNSPDEIRKLRQAIAADKDPDLQNCSRRADFYNLSACRDLILHVQEHRFTLEGIQKLLEDNGLKFKEFFLSRHKFVQLFKNRFPQDEAGADLENWKILEKEHPLFFASMYHFAAAHKD